MKEPPMLRDMTFPRAIPRNIPKAPPIRQIITASIRNCLRITAGFAPIAFLMPISRVLSVTDTSIIFMRPMEAPISVITPMAMPPITTTCRFSNRVCAMASLLVISKLFWSVTFIFLMFLNTAVASPITLSMMSLPGTMTVMV
ncbi:hypothetical protein D3C86_1760830 [compost metagenome]